MEEEKDHGAELAAAPTIPDVSESEAASLPDRIRAYFAWCEDPQFMPCPRCWGKGYHHGFGEHGHDPDWCEDCGGPGEEPTEPGTWSPDDLLREALDALTGGNQGAMEPAQATSASEALKANSQTTSEASR
jgi:hypothetical protein